MRTVDEGTPVVTGSGLVTALGHGTQSAWGALLDGRTAISPVGDAPSQSDLELAALVERPYLRVQVPRALEPQIKFLNGSGELAVEAAAEAWVPSEAVPPERRGLWLSQMDAWDWSCVELRAAFVDATEDFTRPPDAETLNRSNVRYTKPFFLLESIKNNAFSFVANWFDLQGANTSTAGFAGATLPLLDQAARALTRHDLDRALVVAAGRAAQAVARRDFALHGLRRPGADQACRPLDRGGLGLVAGEGAAAVTLERRETAEQGGRPMAAAILGFGGATGDPLEDAPAPTAETLARAARAALAEAEVAPGDLLGIVLPAFGLPAADAVQLEAVQALPEAEGTPVVSWRGAFGHLALAADLADVVLASRALAAKRLPGTVGLQSPLPSSSPLPTAATEGEGDAVLVLTAGLQGEAAALVVGRP